MQTLEPATLTAYVRMNSMNNLDKEPKEAACWNWVLYGLKPLPVAYPNVLFAYVDRGETRVVSRREAETTIASNDGGVWDCMQEDQPLRTELDQVRRAYDEAPDTTDTRNAIRDRLFELTLRMAGFTISHAPTPYRVGMIEPKDVVMWDHWWLEINLAVVETVTDDPLYAYSNRYLAPAFNFPRDRIARKAGLGVALQARVHDRYVTALQDSQVGWLEALAGS